jgi:hypothetical protein
MANGRLVKGRRLTRYSQAVVISKRCKTVVAIPVCNEEDHIDRCLRALDAQEGAHFDDIVLLINNTSDATALVARGASFRQPSQLHIVEVSLPSEHANAGHARRLAMNEAARLAGEDGLMRSNVLTTFCVTQFMRGLILIPPIHCPDTRNIRGRALR